MSAISRSRRPMALLGVLVLAVACAGTKAPSVAPHGVADLEILPPPPREPAPEGYRPKLGPPESPPQVEYRPLPAYPSAALDDEIGCSAKLLYHILTDGTVALVRLEWPDPPPPRYRRSFEDAIRDAITTWRYDPARKWVPTKMEDGSTKAVPRAIPKAERAIVRFRVEDGRGVVE